MAARLGGVRTYLVNLLEFLPASVDAEIFVLAPHGVPLPVAGGNVHLIEVSPSLANPFVRALWEKRELPRLIRRMEIDLLFCPGGIIGCQVPGKCKTMVMFRNMLPFDPVQRKSYPLGYMRFRHWMLERLLMSSMLRADCVIFISHFARQVIEARAGHTLNSAVVIPHGIHPCFRDPGLQDEEMPQGFPAKGYLLYASHIDFYKSHLEVLRAYAELKRRRRVEEKLVFVGSEAADYGRAVRAEIARLGLQDDVVLAGSLPYRQMPRAYHNATVNIFASRCENCPNILLEALAAGRPVVSSNCPPMPEFAGDAALYFDPASPRHLADTLESLLDDPARMRHMAGKARERSQQFAWHETAAATWRLMEAIAGRHSHASTVSAIDHEVLRN